MISAVHATYSDSARVTPEQSHYSPSSKTFTRVVSWAELLKNSEELAGVNEAFEEQEIDVDLARSCSTEELRSLMPGKPLGPAADP